MASLSSERPVAVAAVTLVFDFAGLATPILETPRFPDETNHGAGTTTSMEFSSHAGDGLEGR